MFTNKWDQLQFSASKYISNSRTLPWFLVFSKKPSLFHYISRKIWYISCLILWPLRISAIFCKMLPSVTPPLCGDWLPRSSWQSRWELQRSLAIMMERTKLIVYKIVIHSSSTYFIMTSLVKHSQQKVDFWSESWSRQRLFDWAYFGLSMSNKNWAQF